MKEGFPGSQFLSVIVSKSFINTSFREHANKSMFLKKKQEQSQLMWLLGDTLLKHFCGNRCAVLPLCLFPGARLHAEADAPT